MSDSESISNDESEVFTNDFIESILTLVMTKMMTYIPMI